MNVVPMAKFPKWVEPPIHPCNDAPMMSSREIDELAADIKKHGLQEPIVYWRDNREEANGAEGPFPLFLLDGRNRREALSRLGVTDPNKAKFGKLVCTPVYIVKAIKQVSTLGRGKISTQWETDVDPEKFHLSMNVYRRHLTAEQRRWEIKRLLMANPGMTNVDIGKKLGVTRSAVFNVRSKTNLDSSIEVRRQKIREAIARNPTASTYAIAKKLGVKSKTVKRVRNEQLGLPRKAKKSKRRHGGEVAAGQFVQWIIKNAEPEDLPKIAKWLRYLSPKTRKFLLAHIEELKS